MGKVRRAVIQNWNDPQWLSRMLFPERDIFRRHIPVAAQVAILVGLTIVFTGLGHFIPAEGFIGFDWVHFFVNDYVMPFHPPWVVYLIRPLTWSLLIGLTLSAVGLAVLKRAAHPLSAVFALLTLPLFWTIFLGQLEGLVVLGLLGLPWLTPLALIKPQVSVFAFGARRSYLLALGIVLGLSVLIWGFWPARMFAYERYYPAGRVDTDISLRWWGLPLALLLLWWSRGDGDMLMAAGSFATLHLIPYNLLPIVPAIARLRPRAALVASLLSWLPFSANWLGPGGWWLGWVFVGFLWLCLAAQRYPQAHVSQWLRRFIVQEP